MSPTNSQIFVSDLLAGKVALVSGMGTGIGRKTACELARLGATVVGCGRRMDPLEETRAMIVDAGGSADVRATDIRDEEAVGELVDWALERHSRLDLLVNNAGGQFMAPAEDISAKGFRTVIELNVQGTWNMTYAAATKAFIPQGGGKIVSITLSPHSGMPGIVHSSAARAAVENMTKTLSVEWSRYGITLTAIAPGQIATEAFLTNYPEIVVDGIASTIPLGRLGTPEEVAWLVAYVASPAGDFLSGTTLTLDGARDNWFGAWPPRLPSPADG